MFTSWKVEKNIKMFSFRLYITVLLPNIVPHKRIGGGGHPLSDTQLHTDTHTLSDTTPVVQYRASINPKTFADRISQILPWDKTKQMRDVTHNVLPL